MPAPPSASTSCAASGPTRPSMCCSSIRSQHRVGRKSRENMIWPQVSLAQLAALLYPDYSVQIVDAIAERLTWPQFETRLRAATPRYYLTQVTAPTLQNDMYGVFLAKA